MPVPITINARDTSVSPRLREYIEKKVSKLDRYLASISEARMDLAEVKNARSAGDRQVAQLTVMSRGAVLRAEERDDDIFAAVDAVLDKMHRQIERYKGKHHRGRGNGAGADMVAVEEPAPVEVEDEAPLTIVRRKHFALVPMSEAEALEHMQLLGHDNFFVFFNAENNRVNVLYRRKDGNFGLIDPELD